MRQPKLQWGRVLMNAETRPDECAPAWVPALQWGRVLMNAETRPCRATRARSRAGFNGAAFS